MKIFKVDITKTVFVRANNKDEAEEAVFDGDTIHEEEVITKISQSSMSECRRSLFNTNPDEF